MEEKDQLIQHAKIDQVVPLKSGSKRTLLVDDDHDSIVVINQMLEAIGFRVNAVNCGTAAKQCIRRHRYDLLISSLHMKDIDGYTLSCLLKDKSKDTKAIIMTDPGYSDLSGYRNTEIVDGWLFKPFSLSDLNRTLRQ